MEHVAFLRGINVGGHGAVTMEDLRGAFEEAGFDDVRTIASSGNVAFSSKMSDRAALAKKGEAALKKRLGRDIPVHVRSLDDLRRMVKADPYKGFRTASDAKRVITFLDAGAKPAMKLPFRKDGSAILTIRDGVAFSAYEQSPKGAVFMAVLEKTFGKKITTRTWDMIMRLTGAPSSKPRG
ncbi:MAG TPA: DUF1697 domain-containing protein [Candidatus Eisenbacteria bacterium]|nr:DUF1697 domain-containing protein [Candidatus Eisenbacteria bacterium]